MIPTQDMETSSFCIRFNMVSVCPLYQLLREISASAAKCFTAFTSCSLAVSISRVLYETQVLKHLTLHPEVSFSKLALIFTGIL